MQQTTSRLLVAALALLSSGCDSHRSGSAENDSNRLLSAGTPLTPHDVPEFPTDPDDFIVGIDNPYLALEPGRIFHYEGETDEGLETIVVEVLSETKTIMGIATTVVHDQAFLDGELIENTFDWFAEDADGNVWYFGEYSEEIEDGVVISTEGSWEAGVDGALPGIIMLAEPQVGSSYQQEFSDDVAEDMAKVLSLCTPAEVPYGSFDCALKTMEWTPLEPGAREFKYYVAGVGLVLEVAPRGGLEHLELVSMED